MLHVNFLFLYLLLLLLFQEHKNLTHLTSLQRIHTEVLVFLKHLFHICIYAVLHYVWRRLQDVNQDIPFSQPQHFFSFYYMSA